MASTISAKGWVVIPVELRRKYHLTPGTKVMIVDYGGILTIIPSMKNPVEQSYGVLKGPPSLVNELKKERVRELLNEE